MVIYAKLADKEIHLDILNAHYNYFPWELSSTLYKSLYLCYSHVKEKRYILWKIVWVNAFANKTARLLSTFFALDCIQCRKTTRILAAFWCSDTKLNFPEAQPTIFWHTLKLWHIPFHTFKFTGSQNAWVCVPIGCLTLVHTFNNLFPRKSFDIAHSQCSNISSTAFHFRFIFN